MGADLKIVVGLKDRASKALDGIRGKVGGLGSALRTGLKVGALGAAAGVTALGIAALKFGSDFENAENIIIRGTGASGEALKGLKSDFKAALEKVPDSMDKVAQATADLNTGLGLTGQPLEDLTVKMLDLSRITKTDVGENTRNVIRMFGDWSIATEDQALALDKLHKASQVTGIGVDKLSGLVVQFGAPLRNLGFSFEQSVALMSKFEKEGVNTEAVLGGLKIGLGNMAKAGENAPETLRRIMGDIQTLDQAAAMSMGVKAFGTRAGPDLVAAIREGRFGVEELVATLGGAEGSIANTTEATRTWQEKLQILKNKVLVKLEPVLSKLVDKLGDFADFLIEKAIPVSEDFARYLQAVVDDGDVMNDWLSHLPGFLQPVAKAIAELGVATVRWVKGELIPALKDMAEFAKKHLIPNFEAGMRTLKDFWNLALKPVVNFILTHKATLIAAITAVGIAILVALGPGAVAVAALLGLITIIGWVRNHWDEIVAFFKDTVGKVTQPFEDIYDKVKETIGGMMDWLEQHWKTIVQVALAVLFPPGAGLFWIVTHFSEIKDKVSGIIDAIVGFITGLPGRIGDIGASLAKSISRGFKAAWNAVADEINNAIPDSVGIDAVKVLGKTIFPGVNIPLPNPIPRLDKGGLVVRTGLAVVDRGDRYVGPGQSMGDTYNFGPIYVGAGATKGDARQFVDWIEQEMAQRRRRF